MHGTEGLVAWLWYPPRCMGISSSAACMFGVHSQYIQMASISVEGTGSTFYVILNEIPGSLKEPEKEGMRIHLDTRGHFHKIQY